MHGVQYVVFKYTPNPGEHTCVTLALSWTADVCCTHEDGSTVEGTLTGSTTYDGTKADLNDAVCRVLEAYNVPEHGHEVHATK
jgi:hypothetical protein